MLNVDYKKVNRDNALKLGLIIMGISILCDVILAIISIILIRIYFDTPLYIDGTSFSNPGALILYTILFFCELGLIFVELIAAVISGFVYYSAKQRKAKGLQAEGKIDQPEKMFYEKYYETAENTVSENELNE